MLWRAKDPKVAGLESIIIQINFKNTYCKNNGNVQKDTVNMNGHFIQAWINKYMNAIAYYKIRIAYSLYFTMF